MDRKMLNKFSALVDGRIERIKSSDDLRTAARKSLKDLKLTDASQQLSYPDELDEIFSLLKEKKQENIPIVANRLITSYGASIKSMAIQHNMTSDAVEKFLNSIIRIVIKKLVDLDGNRPLWPLSAYVIGTAYRRLNRNQSSKRQIKGRKRSDTKSRH